MKLFFVIWTLIISAVLQPNAYSMLGGSRNPSRSGTPTRRPTLGPALTATPQRFGQAVDRGIRYLSAEGLKDTQVIVKEGALYWVKSGEPVKAGIYNYFLSTDHLLYIMGIYDQFVEESEAIFGHLSFDRTIDPTTRQGMCQMAGEINLITGTSPKIWINHASGHYKPPFEKTVLVENWLRSMGYSGIIMRTSESW